MGLSKLLNGFFKFVICISCLHDDVICVWLVDSLESFYMGLSKLLHWFYKFVICISHLHNDVICVWLVDNLEVLHRRLQRISMKLYISGKLILKSFSFVLLYLIVYICVTLCPSLKCTLYLCHSSMEIQHITLGLVVPHWCLKYRPYHKVP